MKNHFFERNLSFFFQPFIFLWIPIVFHNGSVHLFHVQIKICFTAWLTCRRLWQDPFQEPEPWLPQSARIPAPKTVRWSRCWAARYLGCNSEPKGTWRRSLTFNLRGSYWILTERPRFSLFFIHGIPQRLLLLLVPCLFLDWETHWLKPKWLNARKAKKSTEVSQLTNKGGKWGHRFLKSMRQIATNGSGNLFSYGSVHP